MNADVLMINNPTRGIDVGAKTEIYRILHELAEKGVSIIITSSDTSDILSVCDRVIIMRKGEIAGEYPCNEIDHEDILQVAMIQ